MIQESIICVFLVFRNYFPFKKTMAIHLKKTESPSPKDALWQVWLKLAELFLRRRFLYSVNWYLFPLGKGCGPSFEKKFEYLSPKDALCQVCLKLAQWFLKRR